MSTVEITAYQYEKANASLMRRLISACLYDDKYSIEVRGMLGWYFEQLRDPKSLSLVLVANHNARLAGAALITRGFERTMQMYVHPMHRRCGVGTALLERLVCDGGEFVGIYTEACHNLYRKFDIPDNRIECARVPEPLS